jgi:hypothetical protein
MISVMKKQVIGITLMSMFLMGAVFANAQSGSSLVVSKDVQRVANKKAFENRDIERSHIQASTVSFPAIVISKGIVRPSEVYAKGNIVSKGYPTWAISKGIARKNQESINTRIQSEERSSEAFGQDADKVSKRK